MTVIVLVMRKAGGGPAVDFRLLMVIDPPVGGISAALAALGVTCWIAGTTSRVWQLILVAVLASLLGSGVLVPLLLIHVS